MKKILAILDVQDVDTDCSISDYLGDFGPVPTGHYFIDRQTGFLKNENGRTVAKGSSVGVETNTWPCFIPAQHVPHNAKNWSHVTKEVLAQVKAQYGSIRKADYAYALADWQRAEDYGQGWRYLFIYAEAEVSVGGILQTLRSGGLGGIESDSGDSYLEEIVQEQLKELQTILLDFGFDKAQVFEAFLESKLVV